MLDLCFEFDEIPLNLIEPLYIEQTSRKGLSTKTKLIRQNKLLELPLVVQKDPSEDKYWLFAGYPEYEAYKEIESKVVPCRIQPFSSKTEQRLALLTRMFQYERNSWFDRHKQIHELVSDGIKEEAIAKKLGCMSSEIKHYLIHPEIPDNIVQLAFENNRSFPNLEQVRRLNLSRFIKDRLYAKLIDGHLSGDKIQKLKWLLTRSKFDILEWEEQWEIIEEAVVNYKEFLLSSWEEQIEKRLGVLV